MSRCLYLPRPHLLLIPALFTFLVIVLVAAFTRQQFMEDGVNRYPLKNKVDWNRYVSKDTQSKFNMTNTLRQLRSVKHDESYGYVLARSFSGQQGAAIQALISLQCWVASFHLPIRIVEPLLSNTNFVSLTPTNNQNSTLLKFSDLFDLQHFNRISASLGYALLGTREDFFASAPEDIIFVQMKSVYKNTSLDQRIPKVIWTAESEVNGDRYCYQLQNIHAVMNELTKEHFCIVRIIEATYLVTKSYIFSDKDVHQVIYGNNRPQHVTLMFSLWRTPWYVPNNELSDPHRCKQVGYSSNKKQFMPSSRLMADVKRYEEQFLDSKNEVAVMLRIERMLEYLKMQHKSTKNWTVDDCLMEVYRVTREKQISTYPMVTLDLGKYGSKTIESTLVPKLIEKSKLLLTSLFNSRRTFEEWEESFTKVTGVEHSGYIAALQRTLASRSKCLILVGGGTFQDLALKDYIKYHPNKADRCIEFVCVKNKKTFIKIINNV